MSALYSATVVLVRAAKVTDKYGNVTTDWAHATRTTYAGVSVQPDASTEETGDRSAVITGWRLITPKGRDFPALPADHVEYDGMTLQVDGEVGRYRMGGRIHHVEARLKRVMG